MTIVEKKRIKRPVLTVVVFLLLVAKQVVEYKLGSKSEANVIRVYNLVDELFVSSIEVLVKSHS